MLWVIRWRPLKESPFADRAIYDLVEEFQGIAHTKTDVFRERRCHRSLAFLPGAERLAGDDRFNREDGTAETVMVQEQLALALNRAGRGDEAEGVLKTLLERQGPSSETCANLGRVYKDRWESALKSGNGLLAGESLRNAIDAYRQRFEADCRDALPGINTVNLMELKDPPDPARFHLLPVVAHAVDRHIATGKPDYWDHATILKLAVLAKEEPKAFSVAATALAVVREVWAPETTARNLRLIREVRAKRGEDLPWALKIEQALEKIVHGV